VQPMMDLPEFPPPTFDGRAKIYVYVTEYLRCGHLPHKSPKVAYI
jgi:hypothetical protein